MLVSSQTHLIHPYWWWISSHLFSCSSQVMPSIWRLMHTSSGCSTDVIPPGPGQFYTF